MEIDMVEGLLSTSKILSLIYMSWANPSRPWICPSWMLFELSAIYIAAFYRPTHLVPLCHRNSITACPTSAHKTFLNWSCVVTSMWICLWKAICLLHFCRSNLTSASPKLLINQPELPPTLLLSLTLFSCQTIIVSSPLSISSFGKFSPQFSHKKFSQKETSQATYQVCLAWQKCRSSRSKTSS